MTLVEKMVGFRAKNRMSQRDLANLSGVSLQTINSVEQGIQKPSRVTEAKILMAIKEYEENGGKTDEI